jgi:Cof subfamily protein (haloacid dehalogenase superfamily)
MSRDIRLIGLDLDGTTLNAQKQMTPRVAAAITGAIRRGITVLPATGRMRSGLPPEFLALPGVRYAVTSNGAMVHDLAEDRLVYSDCYTPGHALELLCVCRRYRSICSIYLDGKAWCYPYTPADFVGAYSEADLAYVRATRTPLADLEAMVGGYDGHIEKFNLLFADRDERKRARAELRARGDCPVTSSVPGNLELNTLTANKGAALVELGRRLGYERRQMMAIGDGINDLEMLQTVGFAVAMVDAHPAVVAAAAEVTASAEEDGVALALEKVLDGA